MKSPQQYARIQPVMTEQEKPRTPEELHVAITQLYFQIPPSRFEGESGSAWERLKRIRNSELKPLITKKFDELISESPTTPSYKRMMSVLINRVSSVGRDPDALDPVKTANEGDQDVALVMSLNIDLNDGAGIFSTKGAKRAESLLFSWAIERFSDSIGTELNYGLDPWNPEVMDSTKAGSLPEFTLRELKDFILNWWNEHKTLYGEPFITAV